MYWKDKDYQLAMKKLLEARGLPDSVKAKYELIHHWNDVVTTTRMVILNDHLVNQRLYGE